MTITPKTLNMIMGTILFMGIFALLSFGTKPQGSVVLHSKPTMSSDAFLFEAETFSKSQNIPLIESIDQKMKSMPVEQQKQLFLQEDGRVFVASIESAMRDSSPSPSIQRNLKELISMWSSPLGENKQAIEEALKKSLSEAELSRLKSLGFSF